MRKLHALLLLLSSAFAMAQAEPTLPTGFKHASKSVGSGVTLRYIRGGVGEPILLVHGFGETAQMWRSLLPALGKSNTVIAPYLPGLGGSSRLPGGHYDMKEVGRLLHELVKSLGYKKIRLVGHDIGLMAVFAYAAQYPQEVEKLVLMDAPIPGIGAIWQGIYTNPALWHFHFGTSPIALKLVKGRERTFLEHVWISFSGKPNAITLSESDQREYGQAYAKPGAMAAALGYFTSFARNAEHNRQFLKKGRLSMPVLVIEGERGMGGALAVQAKEAAINVQSILFKGAGHWLMSERPTQVRSAILQFLRGGTVNQPSAQISSKSLNQSRLSPSDIRLLKPQGAGAGTSGLSGIRTRVLNGDPTRAGLYTIELQVPPKTKIEAHQHPDHRDVTVISGTFFFGYGDRYDVTKLKALSAGSFYTEPADVPHFARTGETGAVIRITGLGPTGTEFTKIVAKGR